MDESVRNTLRQLHRWIGLPLGVIFFITLLTGAALGGKDLVESFDTKDQSYRATTIEEDARAIEALLAVIPRPSQILLPTTRAPYYEARARGESLALSIGELETLEYDTGPRSEIFSWFLSLHRNLDLGSDAFHGVRGADIVAWASLFAIGISLVGLYLWLPTWRQFSIRDLWPRGWHRSKLLKSHLAGGVVTLLAIVVLALSGAGITYREVARDTLGAERFSDTGLRAVPLYLAEDWTVWLETALAEMPDGRLATIGFPRRAGGEPDWGTVNPAVALQFRFVTDADWLGVAGSRVYIDPGQSALLGAAPFGALPLGQKLYQLMVPVHTGRGTSREYLAVIVFLTAIATIMTFAAVVSYAVKLARHRRRSLMAERTVIRVEPDADSKRRVTLVPAR